MREILSGVHHWSAIHPDTHGRAHSHAVGTTLLDPIAPEEGLDALPVHPERIVLTSRHHWRSCDAIVERFGCAVHVHEAGAAELRAAGRDVVAYADGDGLGAGLRALRFGAISPDDAALHVASDAGALAFADGLVHTDEGLGLVPDHLLGDDPDTVKSRILAGLDRLLDQDFEHLLFAHGEPVVGGGKEALEAFVERAGG